MPQHATEYEWRLHIRGCHMLQHWSRTQSTVALSSGEAELNSALKGASEGIGLMTMLREMEEEATLTLLGDRHLTSRRLG